jgi:hypothetical protein
MSSSVPSYPLMLNPPNMLPLERTYKRPQTKDNRPTKEGQMLLFWHCCKCDMQHEKIPENVESINIDGILKWYCINCMIDHHSKVKK